MPVQYSLLSTARLFSRWVAYLLPLLLHLTSISTALAQKVIEVDSITNLPSQPLPFDEPFILKIPIKTTGVNSVFCFELLRRKNLHETLALRKISHPYRTYPQLPEGLEEGSGYKVQTINRVRYLLVFMDARGAKDRRTTQGVEEPAQKRREARNTKAQDKAAQAEQNLDLLVEKKQAANPKDDIDLRMPELKAARTNWDTLNRHAIRTARAYRNNWLLNPGRTYSFVWLSSDVSKEAWTTFDSYRNYKKNPTEANLAKLTTAYQALYARNRQQLGTTINLPVLKAEGGSVEPAFFTNLFERPQDKADKRWYQEGSYATLERIEQHVVTKTPDDLLAAAPSALAYDYRRFSTLIIEARNSFDSKLKLSYLPDPRNTTQQAYALASLTTENYPAITGGFAPLICNGCKPLSAEDDLRNYSARLANLKATLAALEELRIVALALNNELFVTTPTTSIQLSPIVQHLTRYGDTLRAATRRLQAADKQRNKMAEPIARFQVADYFTVGGGTSVLSFEARTKLSIGPDFGVVTTKPFSGKNNPYSFVPYLGFHIHLRPYNRDIPYTLYRHRLPHRFSALVGWSLVNIDNGPRLSNRVNQDSVSSFFKGKGTLLTGLGIRLSSAVQFNVGSMWYFNYARNDAAPTPALRYTNRQLRTWPFVGLTVDLSLKDLLNDITAVLPTVPRSYTPPSALPAN